MGKSANQFWERKNQERERQQKNKPIGFEPQNAVRILQRNGQVKPEVVRQKLIIIL